MQRSSAACTSIATNKQMKRSVSAICLLVVIQLASPQASCPMLAGSHLKPQIGGKMAEANRSLHHAQPRARMGAAVMTPARSEQRRGSRNSSDAHMSHREIIVAAEEYLAEPSEGRLRQRSPLAHGPELRALRPLQGAGPYVFVAEAATPTTTMVQRSDRAAKLPFAVHPHMLLSLAPKDFGRYGKSDLFTTKPNSLRRRPTHSGKFCHLRSKTPLLPCNRQKHWRN